MRSGNVVLHRSHKQREVDKKRYAIPSEKTPGARPSGGGVFSRSTVSAKQQRENRIRDNQMEGCLPCAIL